MQRWAICSATLILFHTVELEELPGRDFSSQPPLHLGESWDLLSPKECGVHCHGVHCFQVTELHSCRTRRCTTFLFPSTKWSQMILKSLKVTTWKDNEDLSHHLEAHALNSNKKEKSNYFGLSRWTFCCFFFIETSPALINIKIKRRERNCPYFKNIEVQVWWWMTRRHLAVVSWKSWWLVGTVVKQRAHTYFLFFLQELISRSSWIFAGFVYFNFLSN